MNTWTLIQAYAIARDHMDATYASRGHKPGIAVDDDDMARYWQIKDRQATKFMHRLKVLRYPKAKNERCWLCGQFNDTATGKCSMNHWRKLRINNPYRSPELAINE